MLKLLKSQSLRMITLMMVASAQNILGTPLVPFSTVDGVARFTRSLKVDFFPLANYFQAQTDGITCAPTSASIVLNAMGRWSKVEVDKTPQIDLLPRTLLDTLPFKEGSTTERIDPRFYGYTPENFLVVAGGSVKTRAQVFGADFVDKKQGNKVIHDYGLQLDQLTEMLNNVPNIKAVAHHVGTQATADAQKENPDDVKRRLPKAMVRAIAKEMIANLRQANNYVLVNFHRPVLKQKGGGHISPVSNYDLKTDSFLVLDVNPASGNPWNWVTATDLVAAMNTFDTTDTRGYILVDPIK
jgi:hypothetical protein